MYYGQQQKAAYSSPQSNNVTYSCTALVGTNKAGIMRPDADGYYNDVVLGALNVFNSGGRYYPYNEQAKRIFDQSSAFMRRVADGALRGECGHPKRLPGMSMQDFLSRVLEIRETNICSHYRRVTLDFDNIQDKNGNKIIAIMGDVKPSGPCGPALEAAFQNPHENVCFSIRSVTNDSLVGNVVNKSFKQVVTFDWVNEPGIAVARKWFNPSLESYEEQTFTRRQLELVVDNTRLQASQGLGMESQMNLINELMHELGWDRSSTDKPNWARW